MKAALQVVVASLLTVSIVGCDGHVRLLYLQQPGMAKPPWSIAATTIPVFGDEDVPRLVRDVADELGLAYDGDLDGYMTAAGHRGSFTLSRFQEENGRWVIRLLDWPSFTRSQHSIDAEAAVRAALNSGKYRPK